MINLTPHAITVILPDGQELTFPTSGTVARISTRETDAGTVAGVPVVAVEYGEPEGLPSEGVPCIVSSLVAAACPGRAGVYVPDTGPTCKRDEKGRIVAVTRFRRA